MKKVLGIMLAMMLMVSGFTTAWAAEETTQKSQVKTGSVTWEMPVDLYGKVVNLRITLDGIVGIQVDELVYYQDINVQYLNVYEDDPSITYSKTDNGGVYTWNGEGELIPNGITVLPVAPGATITMEILDENAKDVNLDFYPGYYSILESNQDDAMVICNGMGQAYSMGSTKSFDLKFSGDYAGLIYEFPIEFQQKIGLLLVNPDTYPLPTDVGGLDNFSQVKEYTASTFNDVATDVWYAKDVQASYELGIINGKGNGAFDPKGQLTVAQALSMACKTYELYYGGDGAFTSTGSKWYDGVIAYALKQGFITEGQFTNYDRPVTRAELASFFAKAIGADQYKKINDITTLPDIDDNTPYNQDILALYQAGIVTGSDAQGTFHPTSPIIRAEAAAIINRVINPANRKAVTFEKAQPETPTTTEKTESETNTLVFDNDDLYEVSASYGSFEKVTDVVVEPIVYPVGYRHTFESTIFPASEFMITIKNPDMKYKTLNFDLVANKIGDKGLGDILVQNSDRETIKTIEFIDGETWTLCDVDVTGQDEVIIYFSLTNGSDVSIFNARLN